MDPITVNGSTDTVINQPLTFDPDNLEEMITPRFEEKDRVTIGENQRPRTHSPPLFSLPWKAV